MKNKILRIIRTFMTLIGIFLCIFLHACYLWFTNNRTFKKTIKEEYNTWLG